MERQAMMYLLNLYSRTIHDASSNDKRCRLNLRHKDNKKFFSSYWEAKDYLPEGRKAASPCAFFLGPYYETQLKKRLGKDAK